MKKRKLYGIIVGLLLCSLIVLWAIRVYKVNQNAEIPEQILYSGDSVSFKDMTLTLQESKLLTQNEFSREFGMEYSNIDTPDDHIICINLHVKADGEKIAFSKLLENGFRTLTWFQGIDPFFFEDLNANARELIAQTGDGDLWIVTNVPVDVAESENTYDFVLSTFPEVIIFRMTPGKENEKK